LPQEQSYAVGIKGTHRCDMNRSQWTRHIASQILGFQAHLQSAWEIGRGAIQ
jgi:hypothetical protein